MILYLQAITLLSIYFNIIKITNFIAFIFIITIISKFIIQLIVIIHFKFIISIIYIEFIVDYLNYLFSFNLLLNKKKLFLFLIHHLMNKNLNQIYFEILILIC